MLGQISEKKTNRSLKIDFLFILHYQSDCHVFFFPQQNTTQLTVNIIDVNDNAPVFQDTSYTGSVTEEQPIGSTVLVVKKFMNFSVVIILMHEKKYCVQPFCNIVTEQ